MTVKQTTSRWDSRRWSKQAILQKSDHSMKIPIGWKFVEGFKFLFLHQWHVQIGSQGVISDGIHEVERRYPSPLERYDR